MAITPDYGSLVIHSDASIIDMQVFHAALRDIEASEQGVLHPTIHTYKEVQLDGGAIFPALAFVNGWTLQFPPGTYEIRGGNLATAINPVPGCYVYQTQSAAYAVTAVGSSGSLAPTANEIATAVWNTPAPQTPVAGTFAEIMSSKILTVAKFLGLK